MWLTDSPSLQAPTPLRRPCSRADLRIVFVHTPMATLPVPERQLFWRNFDRRYHAAHPGLCHMRRSVWELPHWMMWLAGVLESTGYRTLAALDFYSSECALHGVNSDMVLRSLRNNPGDVYLFSPMTPNLPFAYEIAGLVKQLYPHASVIFGGVVATPLHREVAAHPNVDYVVHGRGEYALPRLLDAIRGEIGIGEVGNLCHRRDDGEIAVSKRIYPAMPVEALPFPKVDLFDPDLGQDLRYLRIVYSLGCPYRCSFCTIQTIGQKASYFPLERVIAEIRAYRTYYGHHHNIYFGDETFTVNTPRTMAICEALEQQGDVFYDCQTRLNLLSDSDMLDAMRRSGCRWVELGIESIDQTAQDLFKQRVRLAGIRETLSRLRDYGLPACSFMINGFPNQTVDDMRRSIDAVGSLIGDGLLQATYLFGLVPYPGSDLYGNPERFGLTLHHHDFKLYHEDMPPVFSSRYATSDQIYEVFLYGLRELGRAMDSQPHFGESPQGPAAEEYGAFWEYSHV
jgi:radical SAM superfamily enzyme YgiQ (UPF0313 family)